MKPLTFILAAGLALCAPTASAQLVANYEAEDEGADMTRRLDSFLEQAEDSGLLIPRSTTTDPAAPTAPVAQPEGRTCPSTDPLDFSGLEPLASYADLAAALREATPLDRARAYLAMGMLAEARAEMRTMPDDMSQAMGALLNVLDRDDPHIDTGYLTHLTACHSGSGLWVSLALARKGDRGVVTVFGENVSTFRRLPMRLRVQFAQEMIPALTAMQENLLAQKILSEFTEDERRAYSGLQFSAAIVGAATGVPGSKAALRDFLRHPQFEEATLDILIQAGYRLDRVRHEMLLGSADALDVTTQPTRLSYVVDAYAATSDYGDLIALAGKAGPQTAVVYPGLYDRFVAGVKADLSGNDRRRQLAALDALVAGDILLRAGPDRDVLRAQGGEVARTLGLLALARVLSDPNQAVAAYDATEGSGDPRLATAKQAWIAQDAARLSDVIADMPMTTPGLLQLAEQDAVSERWLFPEAIYQDAIAASDAEQRERWRRLGALRRPAQTNVRVSLYDVDSSLDASAVTLAGLRQDIAP